MMETFEEITSYVDNELKDQLIIRRINLLIDRDCVCKAEYLRQSRIKELLKNRFCKSKAPDYLIQNIISNLQKYIDSTGS